MEIAQFQGTSGISKAIKFLTRSVYSHSAFLFDARSSAAAIELVKDGFDLKGIVNISLGSVVEAWDKGGVQSVPSVSTLHTPGTRIDIYGFVEPLSAEEEAKLILALVPEIGVAYDWKNAIRFVTRHPGNLDRTWFCSELVFAKAMQIGRVLLGHTQPWEVPPGWIHRSPMLEYLRTETAI